MSEFTQSFSRVDAQRDPAPISCEPASLETMLRGGMPHLYGRCTNVDPSPAMSRRREQAAVLCLVRKTDAQWHHLASFIEDIGSALRIVERDWTGFESFDLVTREEAENLGARIARDDLDRSEELIGDLAAGGVQLVTVLDEEYPRNLRYVFNRPPFLFIRGDLRASDNRAIAVVGARAASAEGLDQASRLAAELAREGVTVVSGLALGIDAAAHAAAIEAGGRTLGVMGTGIRRRIYPPENAPLATRIVGAGALISQFWPDHPPSRSSFPMRNVVTSGMALGTVVVEASRTSGAKNQARRALEHGKRLFLVESLVLQEAWAQEYAEKPGVTVIKSVDDVLEVLVEMAKLPEQLSLN